MPLGFYIIMAAQFFSALADNALLAAAIVVLRDMEAPGEYEPLLKTFFVVSYVMLAAFVGAFADSMPKWRVMFISNGIKIFGCIMMFCGVHPLIAYAIVGLGAAAYSPAKYGILTEYLPHRRLVVANSWIEGLTVAAIVLGIALGGALIKPDFSETLLAVPLPFIDTVGKAVIAIVILIYAVAALFNLKIPDTGVDHKPLKKNPFYLVHEFSHCLKLLWQDKLGQISLAVTTLFWGVGATLQFIVISWAQAVLNLDLSLAFMLQLAVAFGVAVGAILAARFITLGGAVKVIPLGILMGGVIVAMVFVEQVAVAIPLLVLIGVLSGFFVVPMNALLQHRGHILMGAGHSIAVQNFNEHLSILFMTALYSLMMRNDFPLPWAITLFGLLISIAMSLVYFYHRRNQRRADDLVYLRPGGNAPARTIEKTESPKK